MRMGWSGVFCVGSHNENSILEILHNDPIRTIYGNCLGMPNKNALEV